MGAHIVLIKEPDLKTAGKRKWRLTSPMIVKWGDYFVTIPAGFVTDGASIPRIARPIITKDGSHFLGSIFHDWLYKCAGHIKVTLSARGRKEHLITYGRGDADRGYRDFMAAPAQKIGKGLVQTFVPAPVRYTIFTALRAGGIFSPGTRTTAAVEHGNYRRGACSLQTTAGKR